MQYSTLLHFWMLILHVGLQKSSKDYYFSENGKSGQRWIQLPIQNSSATTTAIINVLALYPRI